MRRGKFYKCLLATAIASIAFATSSYATHIGIDSAYGSATHTTPYWQELNDVTNTADDYGVSWSVDGGAFGRGDIVAGSSVQFQINMHKDHVGTHYADFMKIWVDWGQDDSFDLGDEVAFEMELLDGPTGSHVVPVAPHADFVYTSAQFIVAESLFGELALRARVTCSHSLANSMGYDWKGQWSIAEAEYEAGFLPTGHLHQGEVEDWTISVAPVPEPATILLFGTGLIGLAGLSRRKKK